MKTDEEAKRDFADEWGDECLSDLNTLISEHYTSKIAYKILSEHYQGVLASKDVEKDYIDKYYYPKEFVEWYIMGKHGFGRVDDTKLLMNVFGSSAKKYTIDDVYNYWKEVAK